MWIWFLSILNLPIQKYAKSTFVHICLILNFNISTSFQLFLRWGSGMLFFFLPLRHHLMEEFIFSRHTWPCRLESGDATQTERAAPGCRHTAAWVQLCIALFETCYRAQAGLGFTVLLPCALKVGTYHHGCFWTCYWEHNRQGMYLNIYLIMTSIVLHKILICLWVGWGAGWHMHHGIHVAFRR